MAPYRVPARKGNTADSAHLRKTGGTPGSIKKSAEGNVNLMMPVLLDAVLRSP